jgi:ubiquinone/menaquinone biosynthesis C-methylase UbiE
MKNSLIGVKEKEWLLEILSCPCCLSKDLQILSEASIELRYFQCSRCNRVYPIDNFDIVDFQPLDVLLKLPEPYLGMWALAQHGSLEQYNQRNPASISTPERKVVQAFSNFMDLNGKCVLDLGSGTDYLPGYLMNHQIRNYVGIDPLSVSRKTEFCKVQAWSEMMPFSDEVIDAIVIGTSLDHVLCIDSCFSEIHRVLKKNGTVYIWGAWFLDDDLFRHLPDSPLFKRNLESVLSKENAIANYLQCKKSLDQFTNDFELLKSRYCNYLVDQYHFRHIPITFFNRINSYGFSLQNIDLWDFNGFFDKIVINTFLELRKEGQSFSITRSDVKQHMDQLRMTAQLMQTTLSLEKKFFSIGDTLQSNAKRLEILEGKPCYPQQTTKEIITAIESQFATTIKISKILDKIVFKLRKFCGR